MSDVFEALIELAVPQHGLFLVSQAQDLGVTPVQVRKLAVRGVLQRRSQGVYRVVSIPMTEQAEFMEAVLWAKNRAVIVGESALLLWDLADVNPRKIHLGLMGGYRPRRLGGELYQLVAVNVSPADLDEVAGVPTVSPSLAIEQATKRGTSGDFVTQAIERARARELIGKDTEVRLQEELVERNTKLGPVSE